MGFFIIDKETEKYVSLKYTGMSSESIEFSLVENITDAAKFKYEENAEKYLNIYEKITSKTAEMIEIL
ncbi:hypothetical protein D3C81_662970 [compost metagenome]